MGDTPAFTDMERAAVLEVRGKLLARGLAPMELGERELICITLNAKCRVDEAVAKFCTYRDNLLREFGVESVWENQEECELMWHKYLVGGLDEAGRQVMWIDGGGTEEAEERATIHASCLYFFAVHADLHTLREGVTLAIDTSNVPKRRVGNERRLQVAWQNFPSRPQHIFILGAGPLKRIAINAVIAFASLFAKNKVIARIRFASVADVEKVCGRGALPEKHGGPPSPPVSDWVKARLANFPLMALPPLDQL
uniref:CRAL-TRIO domain-containing protein n=1 Tax=Calcidiscus leptoporus TaxID=127549 RepID=A0A7S0NR31_9EUKA|mmetsp:Transcript_15934/g.36464  ORF Transcript_15934/g.36464 Transcript_15934/m.36464 type:complete len:253 (+) Transcript_15934:41-799(+)|eukprot:CAMPEP_0119379904 /NCGR_PEP_ID=MMETSP1334-20130426/54591_1 /TAXON_ID=127549 /ORGANISM="Calcidiscus leptoporus, Strain RCC1130" /LENGTH=252 /DNA_ID=CAMNT_0007399545 /DNA_START=37 /DNA_END=795 /DNA_ORIENTATION=+